MEPRLAHPSTDTNGNLVQNGQVFVPGTIKYNSVGEVADGNALRREYHPVFAVQQPIRGDDQVLHSWLSGKLQ